MTTLIQFGQVDVFIKYANSLTINNKMYMRHD